MLVNKSLTLCSLAMLLAIIEARSSPDPDGNEPQLIRLPLHRISDFTLADGRFEQVFQQAKENRQVGSEMARSKLINIAGVNYLTKISVGNPPKEFRVLITIESCDLIVMSKEYPGLDPEFSSYYDNAKSIDYEPDERGLATNFAGYSIKGRLGYDTVRIAGIELKKQIFVQASHIEGMIPKDIPIDGILGLSVSNQRAYMNLSGPFETMIREKLLPSKVFSISLNHEQNSESAGELILGGIDKKLYTGHLTWTPIIHSENLVIRLDSLELRILSYVDQEGSATVTVEEKILLNACPNGCMAQPSTSESMIMGSGPSVLSINTHLEATHVGDGIYKLASCSLKGLPDIVFKISGQEFVLTPELYTIMGQDGNCYSAFMGVITHDNFWLLGEKFIGNYYAAFDFETRRIGLGQSIYKRQVDSKQIKT